MHRIENTHARAYTHTRSSLSTHLYTCTHYFIPQPITTVTETRNVRSDIEELQKEHSKPVPQIYTEGRKPVRCCFIFHYHGNNATCKLLCIAFRKPPHAPVTMATTYSPTPKPSTPKFPPFQLEISRNKLQADWPVRDLSTQDILSNSLDGEMEPHKRHLPQKMIDTHAPLDTGQPLVGGDWDPKSLDNTSTSLRKLGNSFDVHGYLSPQHMDRGGGDAMVLFNFNQVASDNTPPNRELKDMSNPRSL